MAKNEDIMEVDEDEEDDNDVDVETYLQEEPVLPRATDRKGKLKCDLQQICK
jgi:hypothetical protein